MRRATRRTALTAVLVGAVVLAGCSGDDAPAATTATVPAVDPDRVSPGDLVPVPTLADGGEGAVSDVTFGACPTAAGTHTVTATVRNSAAQARDYVITVSWVNATFDVLARGVAVVAAAEPGVATGAELSAAVPDGAADCTFLVTAGTLAD